MLIGRVIRNTGSHYVVETQGGAEIPCKAKGNFRIKGIRTTNPVAVGDNVEIGAPGPDGVAFITKVLPRSNYIIRRASNLSKEAHILAANIDQAMLVVSLVHPTTSTTFVDRFLATAQAYGIEAVIAINKIDLLDDEDGAELLDAFKYLYESIGYRVIPVCAKSGKGLDALAGELNGKITLLSGNSGVGKSTLINDLVPGVNAKTAEISAAHDQGQHTTTFSQMYKLPGGGAIIDTPGIRGFGTIEFKKNEVAHYFPEIFRESANCRFGDCTHTHEPGCSVLKAVEESRISQSRYSSYLSILDDADEGKYR
ncbi:MAG: ribosome small subunit-dependent GTPase A [Clostridium sp.]|nr:ribosome small subunit-dependent GTPase A [Clostridium sp.]